MNIQQHNNTPLSTFPPTFPPSKALSGATEVEGLHNKVPSFVWPVITKECHRATLSNYRLHIEHFNNFVFRENKEIKQYNKGVDHYLRDYNITAGKAKLIALFNSKYGHLKKRPYNEKAISFNDRHGLYLKLRSHLKVKPVTLQIFEAILHAYTVQLQQRVKIFKQVNKGSLTTLPKVVIHSYEVANQKRKGVQNIDFCSKTIRNHRDRLEEAGVLLEKEFHGTMRPVNYVIRPGILAVIEGSPSKIYSTENQRVTSSNRKEVPHIKVSTRAFKNNIKIKGIVNPLDKENAVHSNISSSFYKSTKPQGGKSKIDGTAPNVKVQQGIVDIDSPAQNFNGESPLSRKQKNKELLQHIDSQFSLAAKLTNGEYNYYTPLDFKKLAAVAHDMSTSNIDNIDFLHLVVQDFVKSSAQLWQKNQAAAGSWYNAMNFIYNDSRLWTFTKSATSKTKILEWLSEHRYRLNYAIKWFDKHDWNGVLYPNIYFDPIRKLPTDVCFAYTQKVWSKKLQKITKTADDKRKREAAARKREANLKEDRKHNGMLDRAIKKYFNHTYNLDQLTQYVTKQLPKKHQDRLGERMQALNLKRLTT
jgi:hypothetical protein